MLDCWLVPVDREVLDIHGSSYSDASLSPATTNMPTYDSNSGDNWHNNPVTHRGTHYYDTVSFGTLPMWPDTNNSNPTNSTMSNEPPYRWQVSTPPSSGTPPPMMPLDLDHPSIHHPYLPPPHSHPSSPLLACKWLHDDTLRICRFQGTLKALRVHYKTHFDTGPPHAQIECHWDRCNYKKRSKSSIRSMRRDCVWRHTREVHLGMKRAT